MPISKHRRKSGGKSVRHPGRGGRRGYGDGPWERFAHAYTAPFFARHGMDSPLSYLLETIAGEAFDSNDGGTLRPVSKADVFCQFMSPSIAEDGSELPGPDAEAAEAALRFLQAEGLVEVAGGELRVPARFWPVSAA